MPPLRLRGLRRPLGSIGLCLGIALIPAVQPALPAPPDGPTPRGDLRAEIDALAAAVRDRFELDRPERRDFAERLNEVKRLSDRVDLAKLRVADAKAKQRAFEERTLPQQEAAAAIALDRAHALAGAEASRYAVEPTVANRLALETAELQVAQARDELELVQKSFARDQRDRLNDDIDEEQQRLQDLEVQLVHARRIAPSRKELDAILELDEAIRLRDRNQPDRARAALDRAEQLWRSEQVRRSEIRSREDRRRIQEAAPKIRKGTG